MKSTSSKKAALTSLIVGINLAVLSALALIVYFYTHALLVNRKLQAVELTASAIVSGIQTFGETGDMTGLETFLESVSKLPQVNDVKSIRSSITVKDQGNRKGSEPRDAVEKAASESGQTFKAQDSNKHEFRLVMPVVARSSCLKCHSEAKEGSVLGATSITVRTDEADRAEGTFAALISGLFLGGALLSALTLAGVVKKRVVGPVKEVTETLNAQSQHVAAAAGQVATNAKVLAETSGKSAASLEEAAATNYTCQITFPWVKNIQAVE